MTIKKWNENGEVLWNIIEEIIEEEKLENYYNKIKDHFRNLLDSLINYRNDYSNYNKINRDIMINIKELLLNIKKEKGKKKVRIKEVTNIIPNEDDKIRLASPNNYLKEENNIPITNQELRNERNNIFQNEFTKKRDEFNNSINKQAPKEIDFRDKVDEDNSNIDLLMEEEMKKRSYDLTNITSSYDNKEAEKWLFNGNKNESEISNNLPNNYLSKNEMVTLELVEEKVIEEKPKLTKGFLSKLKTIEPQKEVLTKEVLNREVSTKENLNIKTNIENYILVLESEGKDEELVLDNIEYISEIGYYKLENKLENKKLKTIKIKNQEVEHNLNSINKKINIWMNEVKELKLIINKNVYTLLNRDLKDDYVIFKTNNIEIKNEKVYLSIELII